MPFEDIYKEENENLDRRWRIALIAIFIIPFGILAFIYLNAQFQPQEQPSHAFDLNYEVEKQRLNETCESLPKPEGFWLTQKYGPVAYSRHVSVNFTYRSGRSKEEVYPIFILWFAENGWTDKKPEYDGYDSLDFSKGNQTISVSRDWWTEGAVYKIYCIEWIKE